MGFVAVCVQLYCNVSLSYIYFLLLHDNIGLFYGIY
jgi:hypothetical protein